MNNCSICQFETEQLEEIAGKFGRRRLCKLCARWCDLSDGFWSERFVSVAAINFAANMILAAMKPDKKPICDGAICPDPHCQIVVSNPQAVYVRENEKVVRYWKCPNGHVWETKE